MWRSWCNFQISHLKICVPLSFMKYRMLCTSYLKNYFNFAIRNMESSISYKKIWFSCLSCEILYIWPKQSSDMKYGMRYISHLIISGQICSYELQRLYYSHLKTVSDVSQKIREIVHDSDVKIGDEQSNIESTYFLSDCLVPGFPNEI